MMISTTDLPAQMARSAAPCYVLLWVVLGVGVTQHPTNATDDGLSMAEQLARERARGLPVEVAVLLPSGDGSRRGNNVNSCSTSAVPWVHASVALSEWLLLSEPPRPEPAFAFAHWRSGDASSYGVLIRPDGHIEELIV